MPLFALIVLYKTWRRDINSDSIKQYFLVLYQGLRKEHFYWEFVNSVRKICILISFALPTSAQVMFALSVLISTSRLQSRLKPYKLKANNDIEVFGINISILTLCCGLIFNQKVASEGLNDALLVIIVTANVLFIIRWLCLLFLHLASKYHQIFNQKLSKRIQKFTRGQTTMERLGRQATQISNEINQKFFKTLAELLQEEETPLISLIKSHVYDSFHEEKEVQMIYAEDFFKS